MYEHEGLQWRRVPGATSTFEELIAARTFFRDTHEAARWNPWLREDHEHELEAAMAVMQDWTRAEPDFRQWTAEETEEWLADGDRRRDAQDAALRERWKRDEHRFNPDLFANRRALLEQESILAHLEDELEEFRSGRRFPAMSEERRARDVSELEERRLRREARLAELRRAVGDPEFVVNSLGQSPSDRRYANLLTFKYDRERNVRELRTRLLELRAQLNASTDKGERKALREKIHRDDAELTYWLAIAPLDSQDMCSECPTPLSGHGWVSVGLRGAAPCPAWPGWAARMRRARELLLEAVERR